MTVQCFITINWQEEKLSIIKIFNSFFLTISSWETVCIGFPGESCSLQIMSGALLISADVIECNFVFEKCVHCKGSCFTLAVLCLLNPW